MQKNYGPVFVALCFLFSCEEQANPDELRLKNQPAQTIIEGYISTDPGPYDVRVSQSKPFFENDSFANVDNAFITLEDGAGQFDVLKRVSPGKYQTQTLKGIPGRTYTLKVKVGNKIYSAQSTMNPVVPIEKITYRFRKAVEHIVEEGYFVTVEANDPATSTNYYRVKAFMNGNPFRDTDDYVVMNDNTFNGGKLRTEFPAEYILNSKAMIELWSIDYAGFQFYKSLGEQLNSGNNPFSPVPGNPVSNIQGGARGFFCAYSVDRRSIVIE